MLRDIKCMRSNYNYLFTVRSLLNTMFLLWWCGKFHNQCDASLWLFERLCSIQKARNMKTCGCVCVVRELSSWLIIITSKYCMYLHCLPFINVMCAFHVCGCMSSCVKPQTNVCTSSCSRGESPQHGVSV